MIPKVIHYCWFGKNPKTSLVDKCIKSWKKFCPDYEIIEWNEDNFDITCNNYVKEAYEMKKWAFVTDYARLWIIYNCGGVYLDTDVEIVRSFDSLLIDPAFFGFEDEKNICTGLGFGAEKGNPIIKCMMKDYDDIHFRKIDGSLDMLPCPVRNTETILKFLAEKVDSQKINKTKFAVFYPTEFFCPLEANGVKLKKTKNTYSIHWFSATWLSEEEKIIHEFRVFRGKCEMILGHKFGRWFARFVYICFPHKREILKKNS